MTTRPKEKKQDWEKEFEEKYSLKEIYNGKYMKQAIKCQDIKDFISSLLEQTREETIEECKENVKWILTPHEYESDNPEYEGFALKLKEKYCKKICDSISSLQLLKNNKK